ncbi:hypothetical protein [Oceanicoccus sp. KOV_DT_Chl]|uniref:hypothetical protein n=1 Tax=Oceanicoccus sp. KOV_DT_Chl TaxID=1904639 RepID=UPI000C7C65E6|nr:hypothetical protein [Oceanicoccus sp. KOV_DT_Chl]
MSVELLFQELRAVVGAQHILADEESCRLYSQDVFTRSIVAALVVRPANTEQLATVVQLAVAADCAVIAGVVVCLIPVVMYRLKRQQC